MVFALFVAACGSAASDAASESSDSETTEAVEPVEQEPVGLSDADAAAAVALLEDPVTSTIFTTMAQDMGVGEPDVPGIAECLAEQSAVEGVDYTNPEDEGLANTLSILFIRCDPDTFAELSFSGIDVPDDFTAEQLTCSLTGITREIGGLPLSDGVEFLFGTEGQIPNEWVETVASSCDLSTEDAAFLING